MLLWVVEFWRFNTFWSRFPFLARAPRSFIAVRLVSRTMLEWMHTVFALAMIAIGQAGLEPPWPHKSIGPGAHTLVLEGSRVLLRSLVFFVAGFATLST